MAFKMKGNPYKMGTHKTAAYMKVDEASPVKHKRNKTHKHGPGYLPKDQLRKRNELRDRMIQEGATEEEVHAAINKFTNDYKKSVNDPTMPTYEEIEVIREEQRKRGDTDILGQEGTEIIETT
jgi:hypothetical protein